MSSERPRAAFVNLGCRVNRVEVDDMAHALAELGVDIVDYDDSPDAVIVNSCAVTGEAEAKTRKALRRAADRDCVAHVVATGCMAGLFAEDMRATSPKVSVEVSKDRVPVLVAELLGAAGGEGELRLGGITATGRTRPGIKIQDGCDLRCSYCIVWKARGASRSLQASKVLELVRERVEAGAAEVVLTGINLGRYEDPDGGEGIAGLLSQILAKTEVGRVRLSSIEPKDVDRPLLELMAASGGRIAPFLHIPVQSGSDSVLRRMGRAYSCAEYAEKVGLAREILGEELSLGCDIIVGFPGETDEEHAESLAFASEMRYSKMHVFRYSKRPGTPAAEMPDQVPAQVSAERSTELRELARTMRADCLKSRVGHEELVLVQRDGLGVTGGLFDARIDQGVEGSLIRVRAVGVSDAGLLDCRQREL